MDAAERNVEGEPEESRMVLVSHTIVDPRTVVVHLHAASFTLMAVMRSWSFVSFTDLAVLQKLAVLLLGRFPPARETAGSMEGLVEVLEDEE